MRNKTKLNLLKGGSILTTIAPLSIVCGINFKDYFTNNDWWKVSLGGMIALICYISVVFKETKMFKGLGGYVIFFVLCYTLQTILRDATLISGSLLSGATLSTMFFRTKVNKLEAINTYVEAKTAETLGEEEIRKINQKNIVKLGRS